MEWGGRWRRPLPLLALSFLVGLTWGCANVSATGGEGVDAASTLARGIIALEGGRHGKAYRVLRRLASRCRSGEEGREAVFLLALGELDRRNPARLPPAGAQLAARYLQEASLEPRSRLAAESLYLLALDLGAVPVEDPFGPIPTIPGVTGATGTTGADTLTEASAAEVGGPGDAQDVEADESWAVAPRFDDCGSETPPETVRELPALAGPSLDATVESLLDQRNALRSRVDSLSAELERIRGLLRSTPPGPDTVRENP